MFCGRVYVFLFQSFPLGDKSSVNLRGNFHVENVTTFEEYLQTQDVSEEAMQTEPDQPEDVTEEPRTEEATITLTKPTTPTNEKSSTMDIDSLYPVFWSLQHSFSSPPRLFEEENFKDFRVSLEATLAKFKEVPKVIQSGDAERKKGARQSQDNNHDEFASAFNPKYLTSRDLFKLEVREL